MNFFEVMKDTIYPFMDGEKEPLHVGEVFNLWAYLAGAEQTLRNDQAAYNMVQDKDLKAKIKDLINNVHRPMVDELKEFLLKEGIPLPKSTPEKPVIEEKSSKSNQLTDEEIANNIVFALNGGITIACANQVECLRADVGNMFMKYQMMKVTFAVTFKPLLVQKGWLKVPPHFKP